MIKRWLIRLIVGLLIMAASRLPKHGGVAGQITRYPSTTTATPSYSDRYSAIVDEYNATMNKLNLEWERPKWGRDDWKESVTSLYDSLISLLDEASALEPSPDEMKTHAALVHMATLCKEFYEQERQAVVDESYKRYSEIEDTLGEYCNSSIDLLNEVTDAPPNPTLTPTTTRTPKPTWTPRPTRTPKLTITLTPTRTPSPTRSQRPTRTPTPTELSDNIPESAESQTKRFISYSNSTIQIDYPSTWLLRVVSNGLSFTSDNETMLIFWQEIEYDVDAYFIDSPLVSQAVSDTLESIDDTLFGALQASGELVLQVEPISMSTVGEYKTIGQQAYVGVATHPDLPTGHSHLIIFPTVACGKQRMCMFIYERTGANKIDEDDWELFEKVISSLVFSD